MPTDKKKSFRKWLIILVLALLLAACFAGYFLLSQQVYTAQRLGIAEVHSPVDANGNGADDYTDFLHGARAYVETKPAYDGSYWDGGYPPAGIGVCTDVIWNAFAYAGYDLKAMVDADIARDRSDYYRISTPDPNIDFRRVPNLLIFFRHYAVELPAVLTDPADFQPGDIIVYDDTHIAILSDKRDFRGTPYIIHHGGVHPYEENALFRQEVSAHFRFDASRVPADVLRYWNEVS